MIKNLEQKLSGNMPIDRNELIELVDSWGRTDYAEMITIPVGECYQLDKLDVSKITNMRSIFENSLFNDDISKWNTSNVVYMDEMFYDSKFNQDISSWDVLKTKYLEDMFYDSEFNQDISLWNTSNFINITGMFENSKFNGDISNWNLDNVNFCYKVFYDSEFSKTFDNLIPHDTDTKGFKVIKDKFINNDDIDNYFDSF